jgi:hypothetical protein
MVIMPNPSKIRPDSNGNPRAVVKMEIEDTLEEVHGPLNKRSKLAASPSLHQQQVSVSLLDLLGVVLSSFYILEILAFLGFENLFSFFS